MRILIVKTSSMGDLIHTLPALTDATKYHPGIRFDWVTEQAFAEVPSWHPAVDAVIPVNLRGLRRQPFSVQFREESGAALRRLRSIRYEYIIDAQGLIKSAILSRLGRGIRAGMTWSSCKEGVASLAYQKRFKIARNRHAIDRLRELFAKIFGYHYDMSELDYGLNRRDFERLLHEKPYIVFLHGTSAEKKLWKNAEWVKLAGLAEVGGFDILLSWGNFVERSRAEYLASVCRNLRVLPRMRLTEMAAVLAGAAGVVGVDTGLSHLAAALGTPAATLYIATSPRLTGARGQNQLCLCTPDLANCFVHKNNSAGETAIRNVVELNAASVWGLLQEQIACARKNVAPANLQYARTDAVD